MVDEVLRASDKSQLAVGHRHGRPVVIKVLVSNEEFWRAKFIHEIAMYQAFTEHPPPVRVPRLEHTDGHKVLIIEHIAGRPVDTERYPIGPLTGHDFDTVVNTVITFAQWAPPSGLLAPVFDYSDRVERYHQLGYFSDRDRSTLHALLQEATVEESFTAWQANHGDPLPANLVLAEHGGCVLIDFEFTGLFLPGFDLAMLHTLHTGTPGAQTSIDAIVSEAGIEVPFLINQAMVLSRELRLHNELADSGLRQTRLALLDHQWDVFQARLHR